MIIMSCFTENGVPKTGLSPIIDVWDDSGNHPVIGSAMTELAGGFYKFDYVAYDDETNYVFKAFGGTTLPIAEQYIVGSNADVLANTDVEMILKIIGNSWEVKNNKLYVYDNDGITPVRTFDLKNLSGNPTMVDVFKRQKI